MHSFHYHDGKLHCEDVDLARVAQEFGTPLYIYSAGTILDHYQRLDRALSGLDHLICYAVKANSNRAILKLLADAGAGFDIVSGGELFRVLAAGGEASKCTFAGVGKSREEIEYALREGVYSFNVESEAELEYIDRIASEKDLRAPVAFRVNPDVDPVTHEYISTGKSENKFGIPLSRIPDVYERAAKMRKIDIVGVQMHIGSQITEAAPFADAVKKVAPLVRDLKTKYGIKFFSIGGGLGIVYESSFASGASDWWIEPTTPSPPAFASLRRGRQSSRRSAQSRARGGPAFAKLRLGKREAPGQGGAATQRPALSIQKYVDAILPTLRESDLRILLEPGRLLVGNAGVLLTRVRYIKQTGQKRFAIVDAGMNDLIRPALYHSYHEIIPLVEPKNTTRDKIDIVGPVCESGDFLALDREMPEVREGDLLAIMSAGAYGFVMASNYNSRPLPAEVLIRGDKFALVRKRQSAEDLITGEVNPSF